MAVEMMLEHPRDGDDPAQPEDHSGTAGEVGASVAMAHRPIAAAMVAMSRFRSTAPLDNPT
jgi:hypothetical protein